MTVTPTTPNFDIQPATLCDDNPSTGDGDYCIGPLSLNFLVFDFLPTEQQISFNFQLFSDDIPEATEAFQAISAPLESTSQDPIPRFSPPTILSPNTFIIIVDDDN